VEINVHDEIIRGLKEAKEKLEDAKILIKYPDKISGPIYNIYYCSFYCARALLLSRDKRYKKHSAIITFFAKDIIDREKLIPKKYGRFLSKMFKLRHETTYKLLYQNVSRNELQEYLKTAGQFFLKTKKILKITC